MNYAAARQNMVDGQIRTFNVVDPRVIEAFGQVPREMFVPAPERARAYLDADVPIAKGRFMMQPMVLARMIQAAQPEVDDVALVLGAGTGYSAAILSRLVAKVVAVESEPALLDAARQAFQETGTEKVELVQGNPRAGERRHSPYDVILIDGGVPHPPQVMFDQLAEGGRMVGILIDRGVGRAILWRKNRAAIASRVLFDATARFVAGFAPEPGFAF